MFDSRWYSTPVNSGQVAVEHKQAVYSLARNAQDRYGISLVVPLGAEGAIALFGDTHYWIPPLSVDVVSAAGAGDAVLAGLAVANTQNLPIEDGLRLGFAFAASVLRTLATADYNPDDVTDFLPLIKLVPIIRGQMPLDISGVLAQREARQTL